MCEGENASNPAVLVQAKIQSFSQECSENENRSD